MRYQWPKDPEIRQILQYQYEKFKEKQKAKTKAEEIAERERILQEKKLAEEKAAREERERLRQEEKKAQAFLKRISQEIYNVTAQQKTLGTKRDGSSLIYPIPEVSKTPGWLSIADKWKAKQDTLFYVLTDDYMILVRNTKSCDACLKDLENSQ